MVRGGWGRDGTSDFLVGDFAELARGLAPAEDLFLGDKMAKRLSWGSVTDGRAVIRRLTGADMND